MISQDILDYIRQQKVEGVEKDQIVKSLENAGWKKEVIDEAFFTLESSPQSKPSIYTPAVVVDLPAKVKSPLNRWLFAFLFILLTLIGSGIYGYFFYYLSPEKVVGRMMRNMESVTSVDYKGDVNIDFAGDYGEVLTYLPDKYSFSLSFLGSTDLSQTDNPKFKSQVQISAQNLFTAYFELVGIKDTLFVKITDFPDLGLFDMSQIINQWIKINSKDLGEFQGDDKKDFSEVLTVGEEEEIKKVIKNNPPIDIIEKLENEKVDEFDTFHYKYRINKGNITKILEETLTLTENKLTEDEQKSLREFIESIDFYEGEIWIDKKSEYLVKLAFAFTLSEENPYQKLTLDSVFTLKNFNNAQKIVEPNESKDVNDIINDYQNTFFPSEEMIPEGLDFEDYQIEPGGVSLEYLTPSVLGQQKEDLSTE